MVGRDNGTSRREKAGFTLIELLLAVVIVGILAAVAIPSYVHKVNQGHQVEAQRILTSLAQTAEIYRFQNQSYTGMTIAALQNLGWVNDCAQNPATNTAWYPTNNIIISTGNNDPPTAGWAVPPDGTGALGPWFQATVSGNIGGAVADKWAVTNNSSPKNTQAGY